MIRITAIAVLIVCLMGCSGPTAPTSDVTPTVSGSFANQARSTVMISNGVRQEWRGEVIGDVYTTYSIGLINGVNTRTKMGELWEDERGRITKQRVYNSAGAVTQEIINTYE